MKVIVGIDGSQRQTDAVALAGQLAAGDGDEHAARPPHDGYLAAGDR